jgi:hypothetical protein
LGQSLVGVDIDLGDGRIGLCGQGLDHRFEHPTGATPVGVEVRQDDIVLGEEVVEVGLTVDVERLVRGRSIGLGWSLGCHHQYLHAWTN